MSERTDLLDSIANTIKDYREGEITRPTPSHVDKWINQFGSEVQIPLLREIDYVLERSFLHKKMFESFLDKLIDCKAITGDDSCGFWKTAQVLDIQQNGGSQTELRGLLGEALKTHHGLEIHECGSDGGAFVYVDDVLFSGLRVGTDLESWITQQAPARATLHIIVYASHQYGEYKCKDRLEKAAAAAGKELEPHFWCPNRLENRLYLRDKSEVLWPAELPDDAAVQAYVAAETKFPFTPRKPGGQLEYEIFSSEEGRQLLEREFLLAGMRIRSFCRDLRPEMRPLGFSHFGMGFGSLLVTYRNCPNDSPLALWWGDPCADASHPLGKWYPLLPRKTYSRGMDTYDIYF